MKEYVNEANRIKTHIEQITPDDVQETCKLLDYFWKSFCEVDVEILWLIRYTRHDHGAKGAWADLDYRLRIKLKEWDLL